MEEQYSWTRENGVTTGRYQYRMETEGYHQGYFSVVDTETGQFYQGAGNYLGVTDALNVARQLNYDLWKEEQRKAAMIRHWNSGE